MTEFVINRDSLTQALTAATSADSASRRAAEEFINEAKETKCVELFSALAEIFADTSGDDGIAGVAAVSCFVMKGIIANMPLADIPAAADTLAKLHEIMLRVSAAAMAHEVLTNKFISRLSCQIIAEYIRVAVFVTSNDDIRKSHVDFCDDVDDFFAGVRAMIGGGDVNRKIFALNITRAIFEHVDEPNEDGEPAEQKEGNEKKVPASAIPAADAFDCCNCAAELVTMIEASLKQHGHTDQCCSLRHGSQLMTAIPLLFSWAFVEKMHAQTEADNFVFAERYLRCLLPSLVAAAGRDDINYGDDGVPLTLARAGLRFFSRAPRATQEKAFPLYSHAVLASLSKEAFTSQQDPEGVAEVVLLVLALLDDCCSSHNNHGDEACASDCALATMREELVQSLAGGCDALIKILHGVADDSEDTESPVERPTLELLMLVANHSVAAAVEIVVAMAEGLASAESKSRSTMSSPPSVLAASCALLASFLSDDALPEKILQLLDERDARADHLARLQQASWVLQCGASNVQRTLSLLIKCASTTSSPLTQINAFFAATQMLQRSEFLSCALRHASAELVALFDIVAAVIVGGLIGTAEVFAMDNLWHSVNLIHEQALALLNAFASNCDARLGGDGESDDDEDGDDADGSAQARELIEGVLDANDVRSRVTMHLLQLINDADYCPIDQDSNTTTAGRPWNERSLSDRAAICFAVIAALVRASPVEANDFFQEVGTSIEELLCERRMCGFHSGCWTVFGACVERTTLSPSSIQWGANLIIQWFEAYKDNTAVLDAAEEDAMLSMCAFLTAASSDGAAESLTDFVSGFIDIALASLGRTLGHFTAASPVVSRNAEMGTQPRRSRRAVLRIARVAIGLLSDIASTTGTLLQPRDSERVITYALRSLKNCDDFRTSCADEADDDDGEMGEEVVHGVLTLVGDFALNLGPAFFPFIPDAMEAAAAAVSPTLTDDSAPMLTTARLWEAVASLYSGVLCGDARDAVSVRRLKDVARFCAVALPALNSLLTADDQRAPSSVTELKGTFDAVLGCLFDCVKLLSELKDLLRAGELRNTTPAHFAEVIAVLEVGPLQAALKSAGSGQRTATMVINGLKKLKS